MNLAKLSETEWLSLVGEILSRGHAVTEAERFELWLLNQEMVRREVAQLVAKGVAA